ncbi:unnamed protein product [Pleuronectes platessa]|uniref:Uncharacterized protein n=1 Tax=Pleuronectes platessa TaxID=8262 RepID=A0A9N7VZM7_PLEPL|nr:unnamed protein product [Pleuronectes platessa]
MEKRKGGIEERERERERRRKRGGAEKEEEELSFHHHSIQSSEFRLVHQDIRNKADKQTLEESTYLMLVGSEPLNDGEPIRIKSSDSCRVQKSQINKQPPGSRARLGAGRWSELSLSPLSTSGGLEGLDDSPQPLDKYDSSTLTSLLGGATSQTDSGFTLDLRSQQRLMEAICRSGESQWAVSVSQMCGLKCLDPDFEILTRELLKTSLRVKDHGEVRGRHRGFWWIVFPLQTK